jgi:hypothetical protein
VVGRDCLAWFLVAKSPLSLPIVLLSDLRTVFERLSILN